MTVNEYVETWRGKRVVDFGIEDTVSGNDVVYRLRQEYDSEGSQEELLARFLGQVDPATLDALILGVWNEAYEEGPNGFLQGLIDRQADLPALKALFVGDMTAEDCEISWIIQTSYNALLDTFPKLESLRIRGSSQLELAPFDHAHLKELAIECGGLPSAIVDAIAASQLPALEHLELWLGDDNYNFDGDLETYTRLLAKIDPSRLRYLGLRDAMISDELAVWLAQQPWLGSLEVLDLSLGTIGDVGAKTLCESPHIGGLKKLDLSHHYISAEWQQRLSQLPCTVVLDDPEEEDDGDRYVAVSE